VAAAGGEWCGGRWGFDGCAGAADDGDLLAGRDGLFATRRPALFGREVLAGPKGKAALPRGMKAALISRVR
jgi:hypothetical protein